MKMKVLKQQPKSVTGTLGTKKETNRTRKREKLDTRIGILYQGHICTTKTNKNESNKFGIQTLKTNFKQQTPETKTKWN